LQARGLYGGQAPHETFEDMARDYLAELRTVQPHGPYLLGGFSGGGLVAYEMAQQLIAANEQVAMLVMLDTPFPQLAVLAWRDKISMKLQDIRKRGPGYFLDWGRNRAHWEYQRLQRRFAPTVATPAEQFHNQAIEQAFRLALGRYEVKPYSCPLALFRPKLNPAYHLSGGRMLNKDRDYLSPDNGWSPHIRELSIHEVPGDHDSMVLEPNVRVLAEKIRVLIDSAEEQRSTFAIAAQ
jgi:thioesterase domain-containing protein